MKKQKPENVLRSEREKMDIREISNNQNRHPWELSRATCLAREVLEIYQKTDAEVVEIADIGAGDLFFDDVLIPLLHQEKSIPFRFTAIDSNFEHLNATHLYQARDIDALAERSCHIVLMMDVLEHIEKDAMFLRHIKNKLVPGGYILITVPAYPHLFTPKDHFVGHFRRYTASMLSSTIREAGLEIERMHYFYTSLYFARGIEKVLGVNNENHVANWKYPEHHWLTRSIKFFLDQDFRCNRILKKARFGLPGLSLLGILKND
jgi:2-polyprenyl-3-methyl-5-hydroxy-6-metoxy-1,4-benzoquinol methylase